MQPAIPMVSPCGYLRCINTQYIHCFPGNRAWAIGPYQCPTDASYKCVLQARSQQASSATGHCAHSEQPAQSEPPQRRDSHYRDSHYYVAQAPLEGDLAALRADAPDPPFLTSCPNSTASVPTSDSATDSASVPTTDSGIVIHSRNLWMSFQSTRSSVHYDSAHNVLCTVTGEKRVTLWPPSVSPLLCPSSLLGESANHARVCVTDTAALAAAFRAAGDLGVCVRLWVRAIHFLCVALRLNVLYGAMVAGASASKFNLNMWRYG